MVPKYFFIAVFIVIGSTLVASQKCPKDNTNSSNSCSKKVSGGDYTCKYLYLEFFFKLIVILFIKRTFNKLGNGQPCVFCKNCGCLDYCWISEGDWMRNYNCVCPS